MERRNPMSIVRYVNKKTGTVALYESTSHYDPETKQSRPKRKYLGTENPETGELIPSSGKRGRKKAAGGNEKEKSKKIEESFQSKYHQLLRECGNKDARIKQLEQENKKLKFYIQKLRDTASDLLGSMDV
jgi:hypothetical protein